MKDIYSMKKEDGISCGTGHGKYEKISLMRACQVKTE
jgi:hypothetical protein